MNQITNLEELEGKKIVSAEIIWNETLVLVFEGGDYFAANALVFGEDAELNIEFLLTLQEKLEGGVISQEEYNTEREKELEKMQKEQKFQAMQEEQSEKSQLRELAAKYPEVLK